MQKFNEEQTLTSCCMCPFSVGFREIALGCERTGSDNASDKIVACRSRCRLKIWVYAQAPCVRACDK